MKIVVVNESYLINKDIKMGDICDVDDDIWESDHPATLVTKPDGSQFWYQKIAFKSLQEIRDEKLDELGIKEYEPHCYICYSSNVEPDIMVCDMCNEVYCDDCSYTFSLHYQHQGSRCYRCSDQSRRSKLDKRDVAINKVFLKNIKL